MSIVVTAVLPASFVFLRVTGHYMLEKSIRGTTILGMVGAGGIDMELTPAFTLRQFDTAFIIIVMILVVFLAEQLSSLVRRKMLGADQLKRAV